VLVVVTGVRMALAPSHATLLGALAAGTTKWILIAEGTLLLFADWASDRVSFPVVHSLYDTKQSY
jgi:hypothetical protein